MDNRFELLIEKFFANEKQNHSSKRKKKNKKKEVFKNVYNNSNKFVYNSTFVPKNNIEFYNNAKALVKLIHTKNYQKQYTYNSPRRTCKAYLKTINDFEDDELLSSKIDVFEKTDYIF